MTIKTTCPACGDIVLPPSKATLAYDHSSWAFQCPRCGLAISKKADMKIVGLLLMAGVITLGQPPGSGPVALERRAEMRQRPPLTLDDLIDFHAEIDTELDALLEGT